MSTSQNKKIFVSAIGDTNDLKTWSGTPFHLVKAGQAAGLVHAGLRCSTDSVFWIIKRWAWNAQQVVRTLGHWGGYQYSVSFLEDLYAPHKKEIAGQVVINCMQLFPPSVVRDESIHKWFFFDQTLTQLFDHYGLGKTLGRQIKTDALAREKQGYETAAGIIVHSEWAKTSVVKDYGIASDKVHVVVLGANLDASEYTAWDKKAMKPHLVTDPNCDEPVRLIFVGRDWKRKGLDRLLRAFALAQVRGFEGTLRVMGCNRGDLPEALQIIPKVQWVGPVSKAKNGRWFLELVSECDVGCLLSFAEAGGVSQREFHALGLAILGTDVGGAAEHRMAPASVSLPGDASDDMIAQALLKLGSDRENLLAMKQYAFEHRHEMLWSCAIEKMRGVFEKHSNE